MGRIFNRSKIAAWLATIVNPIVPDAHYSECQDEPFSLRIQRLEVDLKLNGVFLFFAPWALTG